jgi:hypothetical protein
MPGRFNPPPTWRNYSVHEVVSALQKAIRRSDTDAAVYWGMELWKSGNQTWAWNRLREILSEDIGPADRYLPATFEALRKSGQDEEKRKSGGGGLQFTHAVILLATAEKNRVVAQAFIHHSSNNVERREIPDEALDRHTRRGRQMGRGLDHFLKEAARVIPPPKPLADHFWTLHDHYIGLRMKRVRKEPGVPNNPWVDPSKAKAPNVGDVTTVSEGGVGVHELPGMGKK